MSSKVQPTITPLKIAAPLSEEVQEIAHLACRLATKAHDGALKDRHFLLAALKTNRLFTRQDALLKAAECPPKMLWRIYTNQAGNAPKEAPEATVLAVAGQMMDQSPTASQQKVQVEHLLLALLASPDPLVQAVLQQARLTPDRILQAIPTVDAGSPARISLYFIRETLEVIVVVLILVTLVKQGIGELRLIPSESMVPTLQVGDRIVVEKVSRWVRKPHRQDILVFYPPEPQAILRHDPLSLILRWTGFSGLIYNKDSHLDTAYIKRIIGLPGDVVDVRPNVGVFINGQHLNEPYVNEIASTCSFINFCGPIKVPAHMYYMMGDNRNRSADSRFWGFLPEDRIIGRAVFRFYPFDKRFGLLTSTNSP